MLQALGDLVIIEPDPNQEKQVVIHNLKKQLQTGTIQSVGSNAPRELKPKMKVMYLHANHREVQGLLIMNAERSIYMYEESN